MYKQTLLERINMLQNQLIVHSIIYYQYSDNIWSDEQFDKACNELVSLKDTEEFSQSVYYEGFKDFDGSTGCHLPKLYGKEKDHVALRLLKNIHVRSSGIMKF